MNEPVSTASHSGYFAWEPPARDIVIWLNLNLIGRLERLVEEHADQEVGGILFGRVHSRGERRIVQIDGYENVDSEHLRGPAYVLSESDRRRLDQALSRSRPPTAGEPVGFFRSHLRKGIYLDKADFSLFQAHFSGQNDVFLVARREVDSPPMAGFFFWEDNRVRRQTTYVQFPLDPERLEQGGFRIERTPSMPGEIPAAAPVPARPAAVVLAGQNGHVAAANGSRTRKLIYAALGVALIITSLVCAALLRFAGGTQQQTTPVALTVERSGGTLKLNWDPRSSAVRHANHAVLWITDGGRRRRVDLPADRLRVGSFIYPPETPDVDFRLDLLKVDTEASESVRYVAERTAVPLPGAQPVTAEPVSKPTAQPVATSQSSTAVPKPSPFEEQSRSQRSKAAPSKASAEQAADRNVPQSGAPPFGSAPTPQMNQLPAKQQASTQTPSQPAQQPAAAQAPQQTPPSQAAQTAPQQTSAQQSVAPQRAQFDAANRTRVHVEPTVSITTRPEPPPKYQEWIAKVPIVRTFQRRVYKAGDAFTPPRPSHEVTPHVPAYLARQMPGEWRVDLRLNIDAEGSVHAVDLLSFESDPRLVVIATAAMRQWRFQPGMLRDHPVACDVVATLRFRNPPTDGVMAQR